MHAMVLNVAGYALNPRPGERMDLEVMAMKLETGHRRLAAEEIHIVDHGFISEKLSTRIAPVTGPHAFADPRALQLLHDLRQRSRKRHHSRVLILLRSQLIEQALSHRRKRSMAVLQVPQDDIHNLRNNYIVASDLPGMIIDQPVLPEFPVRIENVRRDRQPRLSVD